MTGIQYIFVLRNVNITTYKYSVTKLRVIECTFIFCLFSIKSVTDIDLDSNKKRLYYVFTPPSRLINQSYQPK